MVSKTPGASGDAPREFVVRGSLNDIERLGAIVDQLRFCIENTPDKQEIRADPLVTSFTPVSIARLLLQQQRDRGLAFLECDFGDAVWDVMLHLYVANYEERRVGAFALASACNVPQSTALRWIAIMQERGQLIRQPDQSDRRRSFVALAPDFLERMTAHLESVCDRALSLACGPRD